MMILGYCSHSQPVTAITVNLYAHEKLILEYDLILNNFQHRNANNK